LNNFTANVSKLQSERSLRKIKVDDEHKVYRRIDDYLTPFHDRLVAVMDYIALRSSFALSAFRGHTTIGPETSQEPIFDLNALSPRNGKNIDMEAGHVDNAHAESSVDGHGDSKEASVDSHGPVRRRHAHIQPASGPNANPKDRTRGTIQMQLGQGQAASVIAQVCTPFCF
jgi:hypothetical protein